MSAVVGRLTIACALGACPAAWAAADQTQKQTPAIAQPIPFKAEPEGVLGTVAPALILVLLIAVGFWAAIRFAARKGIHLPMMKPAATRMNLVETLHISAKLRLHLVEIDGGPMVVAESGGQVALGYPQHPGGERSR